jgi:hypothetical protein
MDIIKTHKNSEKRICNLCHFVCSKKSDWDRHILRPKHIRNTQESINDIKKAEKNAYTCNCGKNYKYYSGLWKHSKTCDYVLVDASNNETEDITDLSNNGVSKTEVSYLTNLVLEVVKNNTELQKHTNEIQKQNYELQKQNQEFQKQMLEICKNNNTTINSNNNNTTNNKTFNLQLFLNEECKDAMNMSEFINSIQLKVTDLENIGKLGYVEGVSNIIIKQLNDTDMNKRPVHCSDAKRETLYVKEENKWEKDTQENKQMLTAVRGVNKKNYQMLHKWKETHPKCTDRKSTQCDDYMKIMSKVMDGDEENINKVIKKVAKQVLIDK